MVLMLPYLAYSALSYAVLGVRGRLLPEVLASPAWAWLALGVISAFWVLRNLPLYPFSLLAP